MTASFEDDSRLGDGWAQRAPATAELSDGEKRLRDVLEAIPAAIYTTDAAGRITFYNQAAADLAGRHPILGEDEWCVTWRLMLPDGTPMPHDCCPMAVALKENRPVRGAEAVAERPDGSRVPFLPFPTPLRDQSGALIGAVNLLVDISERKAFEESLRASEERYRQLNETLELRVADRTRELAEANERLRTEAAEREHAEDALRQSQKLEAVGKLTSGIAHDFNNLLTAILGNLERAEQRIGDATTREMIQAACRAALRGAKLNEQMLAFSRKQHLASRPVDINALVADSADMLRRTLGGTVSVATTLAPDAWAALVDPTQLELVILNLALNARDALPLGGTVEIETRNIASADAGHLADVAFGDYVRISVADKGTGMSKEVLSRACEPFFTTKELGRGSGLGLSQAYGVARQSGGDITIDSAPGKGTTVALYLPRSSAQVEREPLSAAADATGDGPARVLVVEDDIDVREVTVVSLEALGYRVLEAPNGATALDLISSEPGIDLMIADYAMAGMNGIELVRAVRAKCPDLPVIVMTGYVDVSGIASQIEDVALLKKPYRSAELAGIVRRVLRHDKAKAGAGNIVAFSGRSIRA